MHAGGPNGQPTHTPKADRDNADRIEGDIYATERRRIRTCIYRLIMSSVEEQSPEEKSDKSKSDAKEM